MSVYDDPVLVADDDPGEDPHALTDAVARNASVPVAPPYPTYVRHRAAAEELSTEDDWESDGAPMPAGPDLPSAPVRRTTITEAEQREELLEAAVFKSELHPRWPKGSGKKAGEFMEVGQTFMSGGKRWQIAQIVHGKIYAHEASGSYHATETKPFTTAHNDAVGGHVVEGITYADPVLPTGGKSQSSNVTVVDPYVDHASHDPSIPVPEGSALTAEQWSRFGKADQEHYAELMARFGKHKPGAAKTHVDAAYAGYQAKVQELVKQAYNDQYGSSTGHTLSLAQLSGYGMPKETAELAKLREEALSLQGDHQAAVQWDLYNRCKAPDVTAIHKSKSWSAAKWHQHAIDGDNKVFSGLSQSFCYRRGFFGQDGIVTPLAIRHVLLSTASAQPIPGKTKFAHELEISVPMQMKLDDRSFVVSASGGKGALSSSQMAWFENSTNTPQSGALADQLRDSMKNGTYLPPPPAPANIVMGGSAGQTWVDPPPEMASEPGFAAGELPPVGDAVNPSTLPKDLPWQHLDDDGNPKPVTGEHAGAKQGQYFMGLKGTLYYIGHDPGVKTGYPFRIHKIVDGKFNGEDFAYNPDMPGYYLDAVQEHKVETGEEEGGPVWEPHKWVGGTESKFLDQFAAGEKFKVEGIAYEVVGPAPGGGQKILDLESGLEGKINGDYKSTSLVPHDGSPLTADAALAGPSFSVGDHVVTPDFKGTVDAVDGHEVFVTPHGGNVQFSYVDNEVAKVHPQAPKVGMTLSWSEGVAEPRKATVTKVLADGSVQLNLKPGKVVVPDDEWAAHAIRAYDPAAHVIGAKAKLRDLKPGDKFHGSAGNQTHRPYEVIQQMAPGQGSKTTVVRNLDTGEVSELSAHKSYPTLDELKADASPTGVSNSTPVEVTQGGVGPEYDPAKYELSGDKTTVDQMPVGAMWQGAQSTAVFKKIAHDGDGSTIQVVHGVSPGGMAPGETVVFDHDVTKDGPPLELLKPKGDAALQQQYAAEVADLHAVSPEVLPGEDPATGFDPGKYIEGSKIKVGSMPPGTIFKTDSKSGPKYYQLSQDGTHTTNLLTGKVYEAKPHFKATPLASTAGGPDESLLERYPKGSVVQFDPQTKQTGLDQGIVTGHENGLIQVTAPDGLGGTANVGAEEISHVVQDAPAAPKPMDGVTLSDVEPGSLVTLPNGTTVGEVVSHGETHTFVKAQGMGDVKGIPIHGKTKVQVAAGPAEFIPHPDDPAATAPVGNQHTASPVGTNAQGKTFGELADGAHFSAEHGGPVFVKSGTTTAHQLDDPAAGQFFKADDVPDDVHHEPATQAHVGQLVTVHPNPDAPASLQIGGPQTAYVKKVRDSDGAVQLHGSIMWHKPEHVTVHAEHLAPFSGGDQVKLEDGTTATFVGWTTHPNGLPAAEVDTTGNYDLISVDPSAITHVEAGTGGEQVGTPLSSKAVFPTPHEQLTKGDATTIGTLKPGDQFTVDDTGDFWEVVMHPPEGSPEEYATIKLAGGSGTAFDSGWHPGHTVTFHAKGGSSDAVVTDAPPVGSELDPHSLPDAVAEGGLVPFTDPQGGPWAHSQIGAMPTGAVFEDAAGNVWKVKVSGATPVVSGGAVHFAVDGSHRGKDLSQPNTPAPQHVDMAGPAEDAAGPVVPNHGTPLSQLELKPGVFVQIGGGKNGGKVAEFVASYGSDPHGYVEFKGPDGEAIHKGHGHVPLAASADAFLGMVGPPPTADPVAAPESLHTSEKFADEVPIGGTFTLAPGSTQLYEMEAKHAGSVVYKPKGSGPSGSVQTSTGTPVYVMPDEPDAGAAISEPPAPTADPGTLPPVEGPKGFSPPAPKPVLDPNFTVGGPLDAFTSRKGPGGIYSYPRLHETQTGQLFTDKSGTDYRVVEHGSAETVYENVGTGEQFSAPSTSRVKLTALPPDPGPQLAPVVTDLTHKHGSLENVPKVGLSGQTSTYASDGKTKHPRLGHLKFGDVFYDAGGQQLTFLGSWLDRALVLDHLSNEARLADASLRVTKALG